jgi:hypothetical protein
MSANTMKLKYLYLYWWQGLVCAEPQQVLFACDCTGRYIRPEWTMRKRMQVKVQSITVQPNPGYDPEYPPGRWPFMVLVKSDTPLGLHWSFFQTQAEADARCAELKAWHKVTV